MANEAPIKEFFSVIEGAKQEAEAAKPFHARILLITLLDALSRAAHPSVGSNRTRFVSLIDEYSQWSLSSSYSIRQLAMLLSEPTAPTTSPGFQSLRDEVDRRMEHFPPPSTIVLARDVDPSINDLRTFLSAPLANHIESVRYPRLLWSLRNYVVHELRNPGQGFDFELGQPTPYYHARMGDDQTPRTWELYFPNELLSLLLSDCARNLRARFERDDVNPWDAFPSEPRWYS